MLTGFQFERQSTDHFATVVVLGVVAVVVVVDVVADFIVVGSVRYSHS